MYTFICIHNYIYIFILYWYTYISVPKSQERSIPFSSSYVTADISSAITVSTLFWAEKTSSMLRLNHPYVYIRVHKYIDICMNSYKCIYSILSGENIINTSSQPSLCVCVHKYIDMCEYSYKCIYCTICGVNIINSSFQQSLCTNVRKYIDMCTYSYNYIYCIMWGVNIINTSS
jgi:hypothetical protein